jgi:hypothetical protein
MRNAALFDVRQRELYLSAISPGSVWPGMQDVTVNLTGHDTAFQPGTTTADFGAGITVTSFTVLSPNTATAVINVDQNVRPEICHVVVTTGADQARSRPTVDTQQLGSAGIDAWMRNAALFGVRQRELYLSAASPKSIAPGMQNAAVELTGHDTLFQDGMTTADFGAGITVASLSVHSANTATAIINVDQNAPTGEHNVVLTTGTEQASTQVGLALQTNGRIRQGSATGFQVMAGMTETSLTPAVPVVAAAPK